MRWTTTRADLSVAGTSTVSAANSTRVSFSLETLPATLSDRLMESFGARAWFRRKNQRAMHRLRGVFEGDRDRGRRVTVAGG